MMMTFNVDGATVEVDADPCQSLAAVLRSAGFTGTKLGCEIGYCGACTVLLSGKAVHACCVVAGDVDHTEITTVSGATAGRIGAEVMESIITNGAVQCGYCTPGFVVSAVGLLTENPSPTRAEIQEFLVGNICRCTGYAKLVGAIESASRSLQDASR